MGCSSSKLNDEEAVRLCRDRKRFIKDAVEQRSRFATGHMAYVQSLRRVSAALRDYVEEDEPREFLLDTLLTPDFTPVKKGNSGFITFSSRTVSPAQLESRPRSTMRVHYLRSGGDPAVSVTERPRSPETAHVQTFSLLHHYGFFGAQSPPMNHSYERSYIPPPSPRNSQWDYFWNPFSSLDNYGYPNRSGVYHSAMDDDLRGLRQVREEEGIPELEEETEQEEFDRHSHFRGEPVRSNGTGFQEFDRHSHFREEPARANGTGFHTDDVVVEDVEVEEEEDGTDEEYETDEEVKGPDLNCGLPGLNRAPVTKVSQPQAAGKLEITNQEGAVGHHSSSKEEAPGFTVYVNRKPTSMAEVIKDLEAQFTIVCNSASEVSSLLEVGQAAQTTSNELSPMKMLNPVALFWSGSSRSSSSRFQTNPSSSKDDSYESSSDLSDESSMFLGGHHSTLDRLYAWEKKLYEEVRCGERVRIAYEKKLMQLRSQDVKGDDPLSLDKTRASIRDLHTQMKIYIHSVEAISRRIETLRDDELLPQLTELMQGLLSMWRVMADCHQSQKRTLDDAKVLLAGTPSKLEAKKRSYIASTDPNRLARSAFNLESELRNWRASFASWIGSQRAYVESLTGWLLRCMRVDPDVSKLVLSPRRSAGMLPIMGLCVKWSRFLDSLREAPVLDGLDFFAAGMGSIYEQQRRDDSSRRNLGGSRRFGGGSTDDSYSSMAMVEVSQVEEVMTPEKMADVAIRVLCAGMSVAMSSLADFAARSSEGYSDLVKHWDEVKQHSNPVTI
ncbi:hypothetical protein MLD38_006477 [Melastoma candidum]|uniref:Uncharacterized protein n=1 Tax=Melastoma candidum TaxID=119954 RepID=A0ACB9RP73_9MYRT|nr:hypothetical protein MLD38_006477 [Melastoma candidum]